MTWDDEELHNGYGRTTFERTYRCYSMTSAGKETLESGDKILMPMSALESLASKNISYPMNFEIKNPSAERASHCGVLEFIADEGTVLLPRWMMQNLLLHEGDIVEMKNVTLPKATFMKLQPHTTEFLDISDPKETLEKALGRYSCLTKGDTIMIADNNMNYYIDIVETKPSAAVSIFDTNCETDFLPPLDYKEPEKPAPSALSRGEAVFDKSDISKFMHMGIGRRLDGKPSAFSVSSSGHACSNGAYLSTNDPTTSQPYLKKAKISHPSRGAAFGSDMLDSHKEMVSGKATVPKNPNFMGMGIPKRLDGKPSELSVSSATPTEPQHACCHSNGPFTSQASLKKEMISHPSASRGSGSNSRAIYEAPKKPAGSPISSKAPVHERPSSSTLMGMGIAKRLDGKPSQLTASSTSSAPRELQCGLGSASSKNLTSQPSQDKENISHSSVGLAFGSNRPDAFKEPQELAPLTPSSKAHVLKKSNIGASMGMGIGRRLDGKPSQPSFPPSSSASGDLQQGLGSASTRNSTYQPSFDREEVSHTSRGLPPGSSRADTQMEPTGQQALKTNTPKFTPFTGKKYILGDGSDA